MSFIPFTPPAKGQKGAAALFTLPAVLYVEDEDVNWEVTEKSLRERYRLVRARNAVEACKELTNKNFDLILMDIQLSGSDLNGIEITRTLRGKGLATKRQFDGAVMPCVTTPIVFVTAYGARYSRDELIEAGGNDMITKPVSITGLLLVMSRLSMRSLHSLAVDK